MTLPRVAVIISNYNYGDFVIDAIDSALSQDYEGEIRVYVLDDGSSDGSWDKISSYAAEDISSRSLDKPKVARREFTFPSPIKDSNNFLATGLAEASPIIYRKSDA